MGLLQIGGLPFCATQPAIHLRQDGRQGGQDLRGLFQGAAEAETRSSVAPATQETCIAAREPRLGAETADLNRVQFENRSPVPGGSGAMRCQGARAMATVRSEPANPPAIRGMSATSAPSCCSTASAHSVY